MPSVQAAATQESVGERIRRLRLERGLSQRDVAGPGVSYAYISRIESGHRKPSLNAMRVLARKLRVPVEYLETGRPLLSTYDRDLRLSDAELALRLEKADEEIVETFRTLLREAHDEVDETAAMRARIGLGLALAETGAYLEAVNHLENATGSPAVTPGSRPDVYAALGRCYASAGEITRAVTLFERCLDELPEEDRALRVRFTSYLSCALADGGDLTRARKVLLGIVADAGPELDGIGRAHVYWSLARVASMQGHPIAAMTHMRRALGLLEASEDALEVARAHLHCAEILILEEQVEEAGPHITRAESLFELGADHRDLGALRTQQAHRAVLREQADEAETLAREALDYLAEHAIDQGSAWHALGRAQALRGDLEAAADSFRNAVDQLKLGGEWREATAVYRAWGKMLQTAGRERDAVDVLEQAAVLTIRSTPSR